MEQFDERMIDGHLVRIDRTLCVGFGDCIDVAADAFVLDDEGIATFLESATELTRERLVEAAESCPVDAIMVLNGDGTQAAP